MLTLSRNGDIRELVLNKDYSKELSEQTGSFSKYTYNIKADNFKEDGKYVITLQSKDEGKNENSSDDEGKKGFLVSFIVDNTKLAAISGIVKGKTYSVNTIKATVTITDNIKLYSDTNTKNGNIVFLLNDKKIKGTIIEDTNTSKKYEVEIKSGFDRQTLQVSFKDQAGNGNFAVVGDFLVNSSILVQYYQNKSLFMGLQAF